MKRRRRPRVRPCLVPLLATLAGCAAADAEQEAPEPVLASPPPSALVALVRCLSVVQALDPADAEIRVRAVECETLVDRARQASYVRAFLDVTVLATDIPTADRVFAELRSGLAAEAQAADRSGTLSADRVAAVFERMPWSAPGVPGDVRFADWTSVSDVIQVEVRPALALLPSPGPAGPAAGTMRLEEFVRTETAGLGPVRTRLRVDRPEEGVLDLRCAIRPPDGVSGYSRGDIGTALRRLDRGSPGAAVTRVVLSPGAPGSDVSANDWHFEAELSVRLTEPVGSGRGARP